MNYEQQLVTAKTTADIFEIVKVMVKEFLGVEQAGLMVGFTDLGMHGRGFVGAFYSLNANMIIINKQPLARLQADSELYKHYLFHIMLHEYIHSIGSYDEHQTRQLVFEASKRFFGENHKITQLAANISTFMSNLTYASPDYTPPEDINIDFVSGIDRKNTDYIN